MLIVAGVREDGHREILAVAVADTESEATYHQVFRDLKARGLSPAVARLPERAIEECLACLAFPLAHRARIRTTNGLERLHEEIKRRTRVVLGALWADSQKQKPVCGW